MESGDGLKVTATAYRKVTVHTKEAFIVLNSVFYIPSLEI